jgi:hypothetical protein
MNKLLVFIVFLSQYPLLSNVYASSRCAKDSLGMVYCSKNPGGSAMQDSLGMVVCGKGECDKGSLGMIECSREAGGGAIRGNLGMVECTGGCESASSSNCVSGSL